MKTTPIYRLDHYDNNGNGKLIGFYLSKKEAEMEMELTENVELTSEPENIAHYQLTVFNALAEKELNYNDLNEMMMKFWGKGDIINDFYFV